MEPHNITMRERSPEQMRIDRKNNERKQWLVIHQPFCIFCLKPVDGSADLCHKIRRSYASRFYSREVLQTMFLNTGLGHRDCHRLFDDNPEQAKLLPGTARILQDIKSIDGEYYRTIAERYTL